MKNIDRISPPTPATIERDYFKVIEDLRNSLRSQYVLVITTKSEKLNGYVADLNSLGDRVKIKQDSTELELNISDILITE